MKNYSKIAEQLENKLTDEEKEWLFVFTLSHVASYDPDIAEQVAKRLGVSMESSEEIRERGTAMGAERLYKNLGNP